MVVRWRVSLEPDVAAVFTPEMEALERDLVGLEEWAAAELRDKGRQKLRMMRLYKFGLTDDLGTPYFPMGSGNGGRPHEISGNARFEPPTPSGVSALSLSWLGVDVPIPITWTPGFDVDCPKRYSPDGGGVPHRTLDRCDRVDRGGSVVRRGPPDSAASDLGSPVVSGLDGVRASEDTHKASPRHVAGFRIPVSCSVHA